MKKIDVVISYFNEDLTWVDELDKKYINNIFIYNKSGDSRYIPLPNIGLDSHTHLYHIVHNYDNLADATIFLQGNPFGHQCEPKSVSEINRWTYELQKKEHTTNYGFSKLDDGLYGGKITSWNGHFLSDSGYTIDQWIMNFLDMKISDVNIPVYWSSQFGVDKKLILKNDKNLYEKLLDQHTTTHVEVAHFMERIWGVLFKVDYDHSPGKIISSYDNNEMVVFNFRSPSKDVPEGMFEISINPSTSAFLDEKQFPLTILHKSLNGKIKWKSRMYPGWFSHYPNNSYTSAELIDSIGNKLFEWKWDVFVHGDFGHQFLENWANLNKGSNGIAVGTNDGMSGEWVGPVINGKLKATLVEASKKQYCELFDFYNEYPWVTLKNNLVSSKGGPVYFYEGGDGITNSCNKEITLKYVNDADILEIKMDSLSINDLISESSANGEVRWIHLDVEGIDGELIYSINPDMMPEVIIFESVHMSEEYKYDLINYLSKIGFNCVNSGYNTICFK